MESVRTNPDAELVYIHSMKIKYKWTIRFAILTPVLVLICVFFMGAGHGWYTPAMLLFPWATFNVMWQDYLSEPIVFVGLFQFIIYGLLIESFQTKQGRKRLVVGIICSHILLVLLILLLKNPEMR